MNRVIETWQVRKPAVESAGGLVASQHYAASDVGARVLADGGNAVDAAVAASLAIGTVEPWMSGLGGGGFMLVYRARENRVDAVDFGMIAAAGLDPATYPLTNSQGADLFAWPAVKDDRNLQGYHAIAVPGYVAGLDLALKEFGTRSWADMLAPAIASAEAGMQADWYASLKIATGAATLSRYEESKRTYLPDGFPPIGEWGGPVPSIKLGRLADTLKRLAAVGARDFYEGDIAHSLVADLQAGGSPISAADLAGYQARILPAISADYRGATVYGAPGLTAGPTLHNALGMLSEALQPGGAPGPDAYKAYAQSLLAAYADRLETMGDANETSSPSCTTHLTVVDAEGNMVALTQTLLSLFGSKVMLPGTGIMMNNGIMWFDPRPGRPNSIGPGKRPLSNMCPVIVERGDGYRFAAGASGGRRILPAVFQLVSFLTDYRMSMDQAVHQPRLDVSGTDLVAIDDRLDPAAVDALSAAFNVTVQQHGVYPALFACPNAVARDPASGRNSGGAFVMSPWAKVSEQGGAG